MMSRLLTVAIAAAVARSASSNVAPALRGGHNASKAGVDGEEDVTKGSVAGKQVGLIAPWWITYGWLVATVGATPNVTVGDLESIPNEASFRVALFCNDSARTQGLAVLLLTHVGKVNIDVVGLVEGGASEKQAIHNTLQGNPYYSSAFTQHTGLFVVMQPRTVQIFTDSMADPYSMTTLTAQDAFQQFFKPVLPSGVPLTVTTRPDSWPGVPEPRSGADDP